MKRLLRSVGFMSILVTALGLSVEADTVKTETHSGSIASIADDAPTFVLAEVGPWQVRDGATVITHRTIALAAETEFSIVARVDSAPSGFRGDFVEFPIGPERVYLNDYVTVVCRRDGKRLVALTITVIEMPAPEARESSRTSSAPSRARCCWR